MNIIEFKFANFKSYKEEVAIDFTALESDYLAMNTFPYNAENTTGSLLKTIAILGPNASGKSNVIWALRAFHYFISESRKFAVKSTMQHDPFLLHAEQCSAPTTFYIRFVLNDTIYSYQYSYDSTHFVSEQLVKHIPTEEQYTIFNRSDTGNVFSDNESFCNFLGKHKHTTVLPNHLVLSEAAIWEPNILQDIYAELSSIHTEVNYGLINLKGNASTIAEFILRDNSSVITKQLEKLLTISDIGINSMNIIRHGDQEFVLPNTLSEDVKKEIIERNRWEFKFGHKNRNNEVIEFQLDAESVGTQHLFTLGSVILNTLKKGGILAIDEMNLAIHPQLFKVLVQLFHEPKSNPKNAQLIFTTHDTTIVSDNIMRADQIWFTEKNEYGESDLYSAQDFEDMQICVPFEKWYRAGRFGAVPNISNLLNLFDKAHEKE